ncbi:hypothetical protein PVAND_004502 [Polypedilum vanderplanki]|uniref:DRBM domain-containing protein n=1 Tax=Polypedilum vanderplanki TaxID=319348 RepID=A0A9J6BZB1_POLVA|nr:hypothetical protein PVAND_004502 [Polypedilum vanderplanki]
MQEILLEDQLRSQLVLQDQTNLVPDAHHQQAQQNRRRKVKKAQPKSDLSENVDVGESLKNEIDFLPMKTPISILQELLSRRGITPNYELVQIEGAVHEPSFRYRVSFNDKDAMGVGRSKKEAKHAAAKALIDKLTGMNISDQFYQQKGSFNNNGGTGGAATGNQSFDEKNSTGNPIGILQELCMQRHWPPPQYEVEVEIGLPHCREFTIACCVLKFREVGTGKSKKVAKRQAAQRMWERLQNQSLDQNEIVQSCIDEANDENMCLNTKDVNYVAFLHEIATEHQFEVTYVEIEEKSLSGRYQCLVQLSTLPVAVCQGSGANSKEAQSSAAKAALEYLKIMTKKFYRHITTCVR